MLVGQLTRLPFHSGYATDYVSLCFAFSMLLLHPQQQHMNNSHIKLAHNIENDHELLYSSFPYKLYTFINKFWKLNLGLDAYGIKV